MKHNNNHLEESCTAEDGVVAAVWNTGGCVGVNEGLVHASEDPLGHGPVEVSLAGVEAVHLGVASLPELLTHHSCPTGHVENLS